MNIITTWKEKAVEKHGSIEEGVKHLNMICDYRYTVYDINKIERGLRNLPACIFNLMLNDVLLSVLERAGFENAATTGDIKDFMELVDTLSPPRRVDK